MARTARRAEGCPGSFCCSRQSKRRAVRHARASVAGKRRKLLCRRAQPQALELLACRGQTADRPTVPGSACTVVSKSLARASGRNACGDGSASSSSPSVFMITSLSSARISVAGAKALLRPGDLAGLADRNTAAAPRPRPAVRRCRTNSRPCSTQVVYWLDITLSLSHSIVASSADISPSGHRHRSSPRRTSGRPVSTDWRR